MKALFYYILYFFLIQGSLFGLDELFVKNKPEKKIESASATKKDSSIEKIKPENDSLLGDTEAVSEVALFSAKADASMKETYADIFANTVEEQYASQRATAVMEGPCPPIELSLGLVFKRIEAENLTVLLNREKIEEALQDAYIARADLLPQVSLSLQQNRSRTVGDFGSGDTSFTNSLFNATLQGSLVIFDLTKLAGYKEAKMGITISKLNYNAILQQVLMLAGNYYFTHVRNLRGLNVIDANLAEAKVLLDLAKTRFSVGVASPIDVTRAEVQVAIYDRQRLAQQITIKQSELNLKILLNLDVDQLIIIPSVEIEHYSEPLVSIPSLGSVLENRYDYLQSAEVLALNRFRSKAAFWAYYPTVSLAPGLNSWGFATPFPFQGTWVPEWSITLAVSMPIFDGFRIRSTMAKRCSIVRQQEDALLDFTNSISSEITFNSFSVETRYQEIELVRRQVALGEQELQLAKTRFKEGVADNLEVVNAQTKLALASDSLVLSIFTYDTARLEWARTLGDVRTILYDGN